MRARASQLRLLTWRWLAGVCLPLLRTCSALPVFGVCLGHQALGVAHGARVVRAPEPMHGRLSSITHSGNALFAGIPSGAAYSVRAHAQSCAALWLSCARARHRWCATTRSWLTRRHCRRAWRRRRGRTTRTACLWRCRTPAGRTTACSFTRRAWPPRSATRCCATSERSRSPTGRKQAAPPTPHRAGRRATAVCLHASQRCRRRHPWRPQPPRQARACCGGGCLAALLQARRRCFGG